MDTVFKLLEHTRQIFFLFLTTALLVGYVGTSNVPRVVAQLRDLGRLTGQIEQMCSTASFDDDARKDQYRVLIRLNPDLMTRLGNEFIGRSRTQQGQFDFGSRLLVLSRVDPGGEFAKVLVAASICGKIPRFPRMEPSLQETLDFLQGVAFKLPIYKAENNADPSISALYLGASILRMDVVDHEARVILDGIAAQGNLYVIRPKDVDFKTAAGFLENAYPDLLSLSADQRAQTPGSLEKKKSEKRGFRLFDIEFDPNDVCIVGAILVLCCLVYLSSYAQQISMILKNRAFYDGINEHSLLLARSIWIGTHKSRARFLVGILLTAGVAIAIVALYSTNETVLAPVLTAPIVVALLQALRSLSVLRASIRIEDLRTKPVPGMPELQLDTLTPSPAPPATP